MSGTSMDGVDLAYCEISENAGQWSFEIKAAETVPYDDKWRIRLSQLGKQSALIFVKTDTFYGHYLGQLTKSFVERNQLQPDFVSSHGHTIFHQPLSGYTAQVGNGAAISAECGLPVINDFRVMDVALHGQGAPLVPIGDEMLFPQYDYCLNLGGFANISGLKNGKRLAFDISPCNIAFNRIARNLGQSMDEGGKIAASGSINYDLLKALDALPFYQSYGPKSIGREWINSTFWPVVRDFDHQGEKQENLMKTLVDHVAGQIADAIDYLSDKTSEGKKVLITGGGAFNTTLKEHLESFTEAKLIIPENAQLIQYKEALIFAFLGVLRLQQKENCIASVSGARKDNIGGAMWGNFSTLLNN